MSDKGRAVNPVSEGAQKYVNKFVEIARKKKEEIRKRKEANNQQSAGAIDSDIPTTGEKISERQQTGYEKKQTVDIKVPNLIEEEEIPEPEAKADAQKN